MTEREFRLLRGIAEELRILRKEIHTAATNKQSEDDPRDSKVVKPLLIEILHQAQLDPARQAYYESENRERNSPWRKFKLGFEFAGIVAACVVAILTLCTLQQVKRQADAAQDQLIATQQELGANFTNSLSISPQKEYLSVNLRNQGRVPARQVHISATLKIVKIMDSIILRTDSNEWTVDSISPGSGPGRDMFFDLRPSESRILDDLEITIQSKIIYDNGVGRSIPQSFCLSLISDESVNGIGRSIYGGMHDCEDAPKWIAKRKRQIANQNNKK